MIPDSDLDLISLQRSFTLQIELQRLYNTCSYGRHDLMAQNINKLSLFVINVKKAYVFKTPCKDDMKKV